MSVNSSSVISPSSFLSACFSKLFHIYSASASSYPGIEETLLLSIYLISSSVIFPFPSRSNILKAIVNFSLVRSSLLCILTSKNSIQSIQIHKNLYLKNLFFHYCSRLLFTKFSLPLFLPFIHSHRFLNTL